MLKPGRVQERIGCTPEEFRAYIEARFTEGMSWENHTRDGWHMDHVIPLNTVDWSDPEQVRRAYHYTNVQPLWYEDNYLKGRRVRS